MLKILLIITLVCLLITIISIAVTVAVVKRYNKIRKELKEIQRSKILDNWEIKL